MQPPKIPDLAGVLALADSIVEHANDARVRELTVELIKVVNGEENTNALLAMVHVISKLLSEDFKRNGNEYATAMEFAVCMLIHRGAAAYRPAETEASDAPEASDAG